MKLNNQQVQTLLQEIEKSTLMFLSTQVGSDVLTKQDKEFLKQNGIDVKKYKNPKQTPIEQAFKFGIISEALGDKRAENMSFKQFQEFITTGNFIKLTSVEQEALNYVKIRSYSDIKGLGNKISAKTGKVLIEASYNKRLKLEKLIETKTAEAIEQRKTAKWLESELRRLSGESSRDFERISDYLMHEAYSHGRVMKMLRDNKVDEIKVYFLVSRNACKDCHRLYLNADGTPKVFELDEIISNGTNIGRKSIDIKPTIPPLHPRCRCNIVQIRQGMEFDTKSGAFTKPEKPQRDVLKERGVKVNVTIGVKK